MSVVCPDFEFEHRGFPYLLSSCWVFGTGSCHWHLLRLVFRSTLLRQMAVGRGQRKAIAPRIGITSRGGRDECSTQVNLEAAPQLCLMPLKVLSAQVQIETSSSGTGILPLLPLLLMTCMKKLRRRSLNLSLFLNIISCLRPQAAFPGSTLWFLLLLLHLLYRSFFSLPRLPHFFIPARRWP